MVTGKIVRFDRARGYGFIAPDTGGEDVFVHANELEADGATLAVGSRVGFDVIEGERGLKAYDVQVLARQPAPVAPANGVRTVASEPDTSSSDSNDDEEWDVLSEREFLSEVTEHLVNASPTLTAAHIVEIRQALVGMARSHGWID